MTEQRALSVTEAMTLAKQALETVRLRVVGEVSEFNDKPGYKAAYFTICDGSASMSCLMWRDVYAASGVALRCGMLVELSGQFSAYVAKGRMQFTVRSLALAGEGRLRMQVAELARKLETEGLMRPERKRMPPRYPTRIAVVTSPRGKAIHDVLRTLKRRYPLAELLVAGVQVEGEGAVRALIEGLRAAEDARPDVVLLVRGGGSYEDLMPFNAEELARTIVAMSVPVVTGIGHEPDTSIADMVADVRASTPTAAAETVAPSAEEIAAILHREQRVLAAALAHRIRSANQRVTALADRPVFTDAVSVLGPAWQAFDMARVRLERAIPEKLARDSERVRNARARLIGVGGRVTERARASVALGSARLDDLSPLAILGRGYSAAFAQDGRTVLRSVTQVAPGDGMFVRMSDGRVGCTVDTVEHGGTDGR